MGAYAGTNCIRISGHRQNRKEERRRDNRLAGWPGNKMIREWLRVMAYPIRQESRGKERAIEVVWLSPDNPETHDDKFGVTNLELADLFSGRNPCIIMERCTLRQLANDLPELIVRHTERGVVIVCLQWNAFQQWGRQIEDRLFAEGVNCLLVVKYGDMNLELIGFFSRERRTAQLWINPDCEEPHRLARRTGSMVIPEPVLPDLAVI